VSAQDTGRWRLQYFYDEERSTFLISDLKFPSPERGIAVGAITGENGVKPMSAVTSDGGAHWSLLPLKEPGQKLFFLNDSLGWMVTTKGLWRTEESGRSWRKIKAPSDVIRVHFRDPDHGWAVCGRKQVFETTNGGMDWSKLGFPQEIESNPNYTRFNWIEFANQDAGLIGGESTPPRRSTNQRLPDWIEPDVASYRRAWPHLSILADTRDGGKTWKPTGASLFGHITTAKLSPEGWGLGLVEFSDTFDYPSEVMFLNWKTGGQMRAFREKERKITDVAIAAPKGPVFLAGTEHFGALQQLPIPRKVKIIRSEDAIHYNDTPVDYRAVARRVMLAVIDPGHMWAATDTGMILKWTP
jgi:photosystem II stability/assembly factor-like uncharacterized protein